VSAAREHREVAMLVKSAAALLLSALAGSAGAVTLLTASLADANENPPTVPTTAAGTPRPASFGTASFVIDDAMTSMTYTATIFNIDVTGSQTADTNDNLTNAHIHAGPAVTPTTNGPVVWGFFGMPFNDNAPNDEVFTPFATGVGGTFSGKWDLAEGNATTFAAQLANILAGQAYINFHTVQFGGGEIRGNLVVAVPEPETYALLLAGLAVVTGVARRRGRAGPALPSA
jgi:CHRD domain/PEP-CTERM motif